MTERAGGFWWVRMGANDWAPGLVRRRGVHGLGITLWWDGSTMGLDTAERVLEWGPYLGKEPDPVLVPLSSIEARPPRMCTCEHSEAWHEQRICMSAGCSCRSMELRSEGESVRFDVKPEAVYKDEHAAQRAVTGYMLERLDEE